MPVIRKNARTPPLHVLERQKATSFGGLILIEALCRRWGVWDRINPKRFPKPESRFWGKRPTVSAIAQLVFSIASGGRTVEEAALLQSDPLLMRLTGIDQAANSAALNSWLARQDEASVGDLRKLNMHVVLSALQELIPTSSDAERKPIDIVMRAARWDFSRATRRVAEHGLDVVWLWWRTLAVGPFMVDGIWSETFDETEKAKQFEQLIKSNCSIWQNYKPYFSSGDMPDAGVWRKTLDAMGITDWSAEVTDTKVENACKFSLITNQLRWEEPEPDDTWAQGYHVEAPKGEKAHMLPGLALIARRRRQKGASDCYAFLTIPGDRRSSARRYLLRHFGAESITNNFLDNVGLPQLLTLDGCAREAYSQIAFLAHNLLTSLQMFFAPQATFWKTNELIRETITAPAFLSSSGRRDKIHLAVSSNWQRSWSRFIANSMPGVILANFK